MFFKQSEFDLTTASAAAAYHTNTLLLGFGSPFQHVKLPALLPSTPHLHYPQHSYACDRFSRLSATTPTSTPRFPWSRHALPGVFTSLLSSPRLRLFSSSIKVRGVLGRAGTLRWDTRMTCYVWVGSVRFGSLTCLIPFFWPGWIRYGWEGHL